MNNTRGILKPVLCSTRIGTLCRRLSDHSAEPMSVERRHTSDESFRAPNKPFLAHPTSAERPPSTSILLNPSLLVSLRDQLRRTIEREMESGTLSLSRSAAGPVPETGTDVLFLSSEELHRSREQFLGRIGELHTSGREFREERAEIRPKEWRDPGLGWLYESDITFVDTSSMAANEDRYIATRSVDGTLYHNAHPDRDSINGSFFPVPGQIYPPLEVFEDDSLFDAFITDPECDMGSAFDLLYQCYPTEHPTFHNRYKMMVKQLVKTPKLIEKLFYTRHFLPIILYTNSFNKDALVQISLQMFNSGRMELVDELSKLTLSSHPAVANTKQPIVENQVFLENGHLMPVRDLSLKGRQKELYCAMEITGLSPAELYFVRNTYRYGTPGLLIKTDKSGELHNDGAGKIVHLRGMQFNLLPVRNES